MRSNRFFKRGFSMKYVPFAAVLSAVLVVSCSSFMEKSDEALVKKYEEPLYVMKADKRVNQNVLEKGRQVKLLIVTGKDSIKVYGYPAGEDLLSARRTLLLYLFEDDFESKSFDNKQFERKLYEIVETVKR